MTRSDGNPGNWNQEEARAVYNISHWSNGYFDVNERGHLIARPKVNAGGAIDLHELTERIRAQGLSTPVLVRFIDVLHHRIDTLHGAFTNAMAKLAYRGAYCPVYPIKVNQHRSVVAEILAHGAGRVGLEAGSKPELMAVLGLSDDSTHASSRVVVCNGYKDREYIRMALIGRLLGNRVYIVVEKLSELDIVIEESRALGVEPLIGMRVRLASIGKGKWQNTGGEKSKFGLSAPHVLRTVERLREAGMLSSLRMLHFHLGSQIANIRDIQRGMQEAARYFSELRAMGAPIDCMDVGGGLGVDYEGTRSRSACSMNYSIEEYAHNVVHTLWEICAEKDLPHPDVITESGRGMTAHHAMLITNVIDIERAPGEGALPVGEDEPQVLHNLQRAFESCATSPAIEVYHDAVHWLAVSQDMYTHGLLTLAQRARAEELYFATCRRVRPLLQAGSRSHREILDELNEKLADKFFCNFSVFQSIPDVWAIDQIFPIVPLTRLNERPDSRAVILDITCDSDGRIDYYVDREGVETTLPLHQPQAGEDYLIGIFMIGAYQEILGDMHNLFGDTHAINVVLDEKNGYRLTHLQTGDTVDSVLRYVHYEPQALLERLRSAVASSKLNDHQCAMCNETLTEGIAGYTYLED
ncbi:MAG: biosynthetic arginine decarboxylase [Chromatiales bacterium]|jgi:arginine decarboxylase|nr:biosynthetic arginine decarboxylase [Chromatiales bacterium]